MQGYLISGSALENAMLQLESIKTNLGKKSERCPIRIPPKCYFLKLPRFISINTTIKRQNYFQIFLREKRAKRNTAQVPFPFKPPDPEGCSHANGHFSSTHYNIQTGEFLELSLVELFFSCLDNSGKYRIMQKPPFSILC